MLLHDRTFATLGIESNAGAKLPQTASGRVTAATFLTGAAVDAVCRPGVAACGAGSDVALNAGSTGMRHVGMALRTRLCDPRPHASEHSPWALRPGYLCERPFRERPSAFLGQCRYERLQRR